jgi:hypothetical protein
VLGLAGGSGAGEVMAGCDGIELDRQGMCALGVAGMWNGACMVGRVGWGDEGLAVWGRGVDVWRTGVYKLGARMLDVIGALVRGMWTMAFALAGCMCVAHA